MSAALMLGLSPTQDVSAVWDLKPSTRSDEEVLTVLVCAKREMCSCQSPRETVNVEASLNEFSEQIHN